ncbi:MAG TPA: serine hydroxymethyltransferase, partial [Deltaproteobacteria bacterium]|nr:serine hydroxymethyltransferase [Deltaproteobacteria bacterium]HPR04967.1 serine hydroxymethyltransferase [Deltaproteobacteria bacterium]
FDTKSPFVTSGIRIGTPALTTRGMKEEEMRQVARMIARVIEAKGAEDVTTKVKQDIAELTKRFPVYGG